MNKIFPIILKGEGADIDKAWANAVEFFIKDPGYFTKALSYSAVEEDVIRILNKIPGFSELSKEVQESILNQITTVVIRLNSHGEKNG